MGHADPGPRGCGRAAAVGVLLAVVAVAVADPPSGAASGPLIVAHRGDQAAAPENTRSAFRSALAHGADAVEMDIRFTRTAYPVVMHDATLDRTTDCSGAVSAWSRTELRRCDAGGWFAARYRGERVPTLDTALRTVSAASSSAKVLLHVKDLPDATRARHVMESVRRFRMGKRVVVIADAPAILTRMKKAGFAELGLVFSARSSWSKRYPYMIPYGIPAEPALVAATHRRGGKVWAVDGHPDALAALLGLGGLDGILVDRLGALVDLRRVPALPAVPSLPPLPDTIADTPVVSGNVGIGGD